MSRRTREPEGAVDDALEPEDALEADDDIDDDVAPAAAAAPTPKELEAAADAYLDAIDLTPTEEEKAEAKAENDARLRTLWEEFKATGDQPLREKLILHYSPLVKYVAGRVSAGLPQSVEQSDLVSYGIFGLIDAIDKFDPGRGFKFETYAMSRIKGAILDELRSIDWVPRSVRAKGRAVERAFSKLEEIGRAHD